MKEQNISPKKRINHAISEFSDMLLKGRKLTHKNTNVRQIATTTGSSATTLLSGGGRITIVQ